MFILIKTLSGAIQPLYFANEIVTVSMVKSMTERKGFDTVILPDEEYKEFNDNTSLTDGTILNIFYNKEDFTPDENADFEKKLAINIPFFPEFKKELIKAGAVIAGGYVLSFFSDYISKDIDIYIHYSKARDFLQFLYINGGEIVSSNIASVYDESFFRKNNIISRYALEFRVEKYKILYMDVMIIPDDHPLENVVTNFDLTFCQIWWNGERVISENIEDIKTKTGRLNKDYVKSYLELNKFLVDRILKYKERGFKINIDISDISDVSIENQHIENQHIENQHIENQQKLVYNEESVINKICEYAFKMFPPVSIDAVYLFFEIYPQKLTRKSIEDKFGNQIALSLAICYYMENRAYFSEYFKETFFSIFNEIQEECSFSTNYNLIEDWRKNFDKFLYNFRLISDKMRIPITFIIDPLNELEYDSE